MLEKLGGLVSDEDLRGSSELGAVSLGICKEENMKINDRTLLT